MARRKQPVEEYALTATIGRIEQSYYISENREAERPVGDEAMIEMFGNIVTISPAHKQHAGREIEMSILRARSFADHDPTPTTDKPFMVTVNLRKGGCSLMAYIPADAFWALPGMISSGAVTHVEARFGKSHHGSAELLSLYFASAHRLTEANS